MTGPDFFRAFLFEQLDIRAALVRLGPSWQAMQAGRGYAAPVLGLLGEMAAVSVLIGANLKHVGRLTFQLKGDGPVGMLVMDCDEQLRLRGMARCGEGIPVAPVPELLGDGQLILSLDAVGMSQPYQSLVPIDGDSIAAIFEHYLLRSEQQPTRLFLAAAASPAALSLPAAAAEPAAGVPAVLLRPARGRCRSAVLPPAAVPDDGRGKTLLLGRDAPAARRLQRAGRAPLDPA